MGIAEAIRDRRLLRFSYDDALRMVEPHCYGTDRKGQALLLAYQVGGGSESREYVGWKTFRVDDMVAITVTADTFAGPRPEYRRGENVMARVIAQL